MSVEDLLAKNNDLAKRYPHHWTVSDYERKLRREAAPRPEDPAVPQPSASWSPRRGVRVFGFKSRADLKTFRERWPEA